MKSVDLRFQTPNVKGQTAPLTVISLRAVLPGGSDMAEAAWYIEGSVWVSQWSLPCFC